jgi:hypothetical protein
LVAILIRTADSHRKMIFFPKKKVLQAAKLPRMVADLHFRIHGAPQALQQQAADQLVHREAARLEFEPILL